MVRLDDGGKLPPAFVSATSSPGLRVGWAMATISPRPLCRLGDGGELPPAFVSAGRRQISLGVGEVPLAFLQLGGGGKLPPASNSEGAAE